MLSLWPKMQLRLWSQYLYFKTVTWCIFVLVSGLYYMISRFWNWSQVLFRFCYFFTW